MPLPESSWEPALLKARPALRLLARQRLPHPLWRKMDPSDVVQITIKEAHERRADFKGTSEEQLLSWLCAMLVHRLYDELRRYKARKRDAGRDVPLQKLVDQTSECLRTELVATGASPSRLLMRREAIDRLSRAVDKLPKSQRLVVELYYFQGLTTPRIAEILGRKIPAVAGLLHRGLTKLRDALAGEI